MKAFPLNPIKGFSYFILLTLPADLLLRTTNYSVLSTDELFFLKKLAYLICLLLIPLCFLRRLVSLVQTSVLQGSVDQRVKLWTLVAISLLGLAPLLALLIPRSGPWNLKQLLVIVFTIVIALSQVTQFIKDIQSNLTGRFSKLLWLRIYRGRQILTVLTIVLLRLLSGLHAACLPHTPMGLIQYLIGTILELSLGTYAINELQYPVEVKRSTGFQPVAHRACINKEKT